MLFDERIVKLRARIKLLRATCDRYPNEIGMMKDAISSYDDLLGESIEKMLKSTEENLSGIENLVDEVLSCSEKLSENSNL